MSDDLSIPNPGYRGNRAGRYGTGPSRRKPGMDPDTRRLVMFAGGLGAVLVVLVGASALIGHRGNQIPVVTADASPIRVKPLNPGGMRIDAAENDVFSGGSDTAGAKLAPSAENPDTKALRTAEVSPPEAVESLNAGGQNSAALTTPPPPPPVAKPVVVASVPPVTKPAAAKKPEAVVESHPAAHQAMVQLAALTTEEAAHAEWQQLAKRMPDLLNGKQPNYVRTERDGHAFWRVRTSGFADIAQARTFCDHVRAKGAGCSVSDY